MSIRRTLATSDHPMARAVRDARRGLMHFTLPAPRVVTVPMRVLITGIRDVLLTLRRVLIAEPVFKSYCTVYGRRVRTGAFIHWIQGRGRIILGDDVLFDGKSSFSFAARFTDSPTLQVGSRTGVGHACVFVVAQSITIGDDCRIAGGVSFRDSPGHPVEPEARRRGEPPPPEAVKPIVVENNVWIGASAIISAGVRIGEGSVISSGAVVGSDVPPLSLMAGNPARRIGTVAPASTAPAAPPSPAAASSESA